MLKDTVRHAPILDYPDPATRYIVYTDASDNACGAQLSQEHDGMKFPIAFLSHSFTGTQRKWSTTGQEVSEYIMQLQSGTTTSRELKSSYTMTTNYWQGF